MDNNNSPLAPPNQVAEPKPEQTIDAELQPTGSAMSQVAQNNLNQIHDSSQQQIAPQQVYPSPTPNQANTFSTAGQLNNVISNNDQLARQQQTVQDGHPDTLTSQTQSSLQIKPLLDPDFGGQSDKILTKTNETITNTNVPNTMGTQSQQQPSSPQKAIITKVRLSDELNVFDWFKTKDIIYQIAEKAKNSVDSVITVLDPGMKEYLYSGGNINIIVISDLKCLVSPIRDAFQGVFGRATVVAAKYNPPQIDDDYPVKLASGFTEAVVVARERIKKFRLDTNNVPQNQVVLAVQPTLVTDLIKTEIEGYKLNENLQPQWFLTFCMVIEDPVLGITMNSYSQFIPIDLDLVLKAQEFKLAPDLPYSSLGFAQSIRDIMTTKLKIKNDELNDQDTEWLKIWSGLDEDRVIHDLSISLAHSYRRKWDECVPS